MPTNNGKLLNSTYYVLGQTCQNKRDTWPAGHEFDILALGTVLSTLLTHEPPPPNNPLGIFTLEQKVNNVLSRKGNSGIRRGSRQLRAGVSGTEGEHKRQSSC